MFLSLVLGALLVAQATPPPTPPPLATPAPTATPSATEEPVEPQSPAPPSPLPAATPTPSGPQLTVSAASVDLNPAQQRVVMVSGASAPLEAVLEKKLVNVAVDPSGTSVTITATQATGTDVLHLTDANGATAEIAIRVAFNAGTIVPEATLKVTGNPADPAWIVRQVQALVARLTQAMPGTHTVITPPVTPVVPLAPGATTQFALPVSVTDPTGQTFDRTGTTTVNVQNVGLDPFAPSLLFYDDDPEHVTQDGVLFRGAVTAVAPARLYYYHDNGADPRRIVVLLQTSSQDPTSVQVGDVAAGPNVDVMQVGHAVSRDFLLTKYRGESVVLDLAQDEPFVLRDAAMSARQGVAGTLDVRVLSGGPVTVTVVAASPGADVRTLAAGPQLPGDGHHRTGVFALSGFGDDHLSYVAGGPDAKVAIGDREPTVPPAGDPPGDPPPTSEGHDYGDYGVLHTVTLDLSNPTAAQTTAYLYFKPLAGIARGSFLVDGVLTELGCVRVPAPYQIAAIPLGPNASVKTVVQTATDGGSFLPVEIGVTSSVPYPYAPPAAAADGCFPKPGVPPAVILPSPSPSPSPGASAAPATEEPSAVPSPP